MLLGVHEESHSSSLFNLKILNKKKFKPKPKIQIKMKHI